MGFVTATELDGDRRVVTFANGVVAHEWVISVDDERRRLAYSITESPAAMTFHHGSFEVVAAGPDPTDGCSVVWTADLLPAEVAPVIDEMMAQGIAAMAARSMPRLGVLGRGPAVTTHARLTAVDVLLTIGEFSKMTYLSVKALRHEHEVGRGHRSGVC